MNTGENPFIAGAKPERVTAVSGGWKGVEMLVGCGACMEDGSKEEFEVSDGVEVTAECFQSLWACMDG